ncbi:hypothetical protein HAX54_034412 [Datura stramonium]|uniref:Uncharacterized protein n=1 Tax=Datura stramonium TaxID=4076 RepID=A0ABS8VG60_DATST|nr:hypothetical protein [Datura stramonium]
MIQQNPNSSYKSSQPTHLNTTTKADEEKHATLKIWRTMDLIFRVTLQFQRIKWMILMAIMHHQILSFLRWIILQYVLYFNHDHDEGLCGGMIDRYTISSLGIATLVLLCSSTRVILELVKSLLVMIVNEENLVRRWQKIIHIHELIVAAPKLLKEN